MTPCKTDPLASYVYHIVQHSTLPFHITGKKFSQNRPSSIEPASVADPDPGCEKMYYGSGSRVNFDTDPDPGKNYTDPDPAKKD